LQARWVEIVGNKDSHSRQLGGNEKSKRADGKGHRKPGGIEKTSRDLGIPASNVRRSVRISKLSPAVKEAAKASGLDNNQSALLKAAKEKTPEKQVEALLDRAGAKKAGTEMKRPGRCPASLPHPARTSGVRGKR